MIVTVQKYAVVKGKPKVIRYRCFDNSSFRDVLKVRLPITREYGEYEKAYLDVLNSHLAMKKENCFCKSCSIQDKSCSIQDKSCSIQNKGTEKVKSGKYIS